MPNPIRPTPTQNIGAPLRSRDVYGDLLCQAMVIYPTLGAIQCNNHTRFVDREDSMDHTPLYCSIHASHIEEELNGRLDDEDVLDPNRVRTPLSSIGSLPDSDDSVRSGRYIGTPTRSMSRGSNHSNDSSSYPPTIHTLASYRSSLQSSVRSYGVLEQGICPYCFQDLPKSWRSPSESLALSDADDATDGHDDTKEEATDDHHGTKEEATDGHDGTKKEASVVHDDTKEEEKDGHKDTKKKASEQQQPSER